MWWEDRRKFPAAFGLIRTKLKPGSPDANIAVSGGPDDVWELATHLIAEYEQNLHRQNNPHFRLRRILLLEGLASILRTCPSPLQVTAAAAPRKFCALGVCVRHRLIGEVWYLLRLETAGNAFYWRLDITERFVPWFRAIIFGFGALWLLLVSFLSILVVTLGGIFPLGVLLVPIFFLSAFFNRGPQDPSARNAPSNWGYLVWPLRLFEHTRQDRLDHALTYAPAILGALQEAANTVERSARAKQPITPVPVPAQPAAAPPAQTLPVGGGGGGTPPTVPLPVPPVPGKVRK